MFVLLVHFDIEGCVEALNVCTLFTPNRQSHSTDTERTVERDSESGHGYFRVWVYFQLVFD